MDDWHFASKKKYSFKNLHGGVDVDVIACLHVYASIIMYK